MVIDEDALHLEICLFAIFLILEFNESILKTIAGAFITYDLTGKNLAKAAEDQVEVFVYFQSQSRLQFMTGHVTESCLGSLD